MTTLLQINASLFGDNGQSSQLADRFVAAWKVRNPNATVVRRDVATDPVPHLDGHRFMSFNTPAEARTPAQQEVVAYSDKLIAELKGADVLVLGLPMYNFGVPSQLKSYFDHIARAGVTFNYTAAGPVGTMADKKTYILAVRGGIHPAEVDSQTRHVRSFLNFLGITSIEFVYAEGLNYNEDIKAAALAKAGETISALIAA